MNAKALVRPRFSLFLFFGLLLLLLVAAPRASAAVWTDQPDYTPGSVVTISGNNVGLVEPWSAEATVTASVTGPNEYLFDPLTTTVGLDGSWSVQLKLSDYAAVAVGDYTYTASVETSFETQSGSFTDAAKYDLTVTPDPAIAGVVGDSVSIQAFGNPAWGPQSVTLDWTSPDSAHKVELGGSFTITGIDPVRSGYAIGSWHLDTWVTANPAHWVIGTSHPVSSATTTLANVPVPDSAGKVRMVLLYVAQVPVTPHITAANKVYNGSDAAEIMSRTLTGVSPGDDVSLVGGSATFASKDAGSPKTVTATGLSLSGADKNKYVLTSTTASTTASPS
jgi:hypothetical protein